MQNKIDELERKIKDLQNEYDLTKEKLENKLIVKDKNIDIIKRTSLAKSQNIECPLSDPGEDKQRNQKRIVH